jgi:Tol biopolymer transport system component
VAGLTTDVSVSTNGKAVNGPSSWPSMSADGRYVVFASDASNLVRNDGNRRTDVFLHDRVTRSTELVSRRHDGRPADGPSRHPVISGDGSTIAFQSLASDLLCVTRCGDQELEINMLWDVFLLDRTTGTMLRASGDEDGEWMAPSRSPSLNGTGSVLVFASRHPINRSDVANDDDLFVWMRI